MPKSKKIPNLKAVILTANEFEDMEVFFPYFRLLEEGIDVGIAAPAKGHIHGENRYALMAEKTFNDINPKK